METASVTTVKHHIRRSSYTIVTYRESGLVSVTQSLWLSDQFLWVPKSPGWLTVWAFMWYAWPPLTPTSLSPLFDFKSPPYHLLWVSASASISCLMTSLWWQSGQAPVRSHKATSWSSLSTFARSLLWLPSHRLLRHSPVPDFHTEVSSLSIPSQHSSPLCTTNLIVHFPIPNCHQSYHKDLCSTIFITSLFAIARTWKQPRCTSTKQWIKKNVTHLPNELLLNC